MSPAIGRQRRSRPAAETHAAVLDAAEDCFTRYGIEQTTIEDIVHAAGVPRATLYRHAGNRDDVLLAVALREIDRTLGELGVFVASCEALEDVIVDGTIQAITLVRNSPLLNAIFSGAQTLLAPTASEQALDQLLERLHQFVAPIVERARATGLLRAELTVPDVVEHLLRTIQSQLGFELPGQTDAQRRAYLRRTLLPVFVPDARPDLPDSAD